MWIFVLWRKIVSKLLIYYAHPGHKHSQVNKEMAMEAEKIDDLTFRDLYAKYPRYDINVEEEQKLLVDHDVILFQFPVFWYSTPSLIKEWFDLVLEYGFAYGQGGRSLAGKKFMLAISAAGPQEAYTPEGYQHFPLRTFLSPLEQTARLCHMTFVPPYVLYSSLSANDSGALKPHVAAYKKLLLGIISDTFDFNAASECDVLTASQLPFKQGAIQ